MRPPRRFLLVLLLLPLAGPCILPAAPVPAPRPADVKGELERLRGEWTLVREVSPDGVVHTYEPKDSNIGHWALTFDGARFVTEEDYTDPSYLIEGSVALDVGRTPRRIDFTVTEVSSPADRKLKGQTRRGIYELDGDRLRLCLPGYGSAARPTRFEAGEGRGVYEFRRVKR